MSSPARSAVLAAALLAGTASATATVGQPSPAPPSSRILEVMKRATRFMVEEVSTNGGYVWTYLPDRSRRRFLA